MESFKSIRMGKINKKLSKLQARHQNAVMKSANKAGQAPDSYWQAWLKFYTKRVLLTIALGFCISMAFQVSYGFARSIAYYKTTEQMYFMNTTALSWTTFFTAGLSIYFAILIFRLKWIFPSRNEYYANLDLSEYTNNEKSEETHANTKPKAKNKKKRK